MACLLSLRCAQAVYRIGAREPRHRLRGPLHGSSATTAIKYRTARLGRPLVSPCLLRQRRTARFSEQFGMSDRFNFAKLVGPERRRGSAAYVAGYAGRG